MSDPTQDPGTVAHRDHHGGAVDSAVDQLPDRFDNPGLPPHAHRGADVDERTAKRAERVVTGMFTVSIIATILFVVAYIVISEESLIFVPFIGQMNALHLALGVTMGLSLLCIGLGAVHWAKTLMPDEEVVEMRHPMRSSDADRDGVVQTLRNGGEQSQITRRPMIKYTLGAALGLVAVPIVLPLAGLGPLPGDSLSFTWWDGPMNEATGKREFTPMRLMRDPQNTPIKAEDVTNGSVFHVMPEGLLPDAETHEGGAEHLLNEKAKAAVVLIRLEEDKIKSQKQRDWGYHGIVAYSKICTHVGCPVALYEQQTHHLLCPCHQSTFDLTDDCKVIFGPAKRALPQLPISVDGEGYLIATHPFQEAVGPSFWERG